ncbi:MAG: hypothetical protein ABFQ65_01210 [Nanoarchaeota archaeon]
MDLKIIEEKENLLFNRKEIKLEIESNITPSHVDVKKLISEKYSINSENIKINYIKGKFGVKKFLVLAKIYKSKKDKDNFEIKTKKQREAEKKAREEESKKLAEEKKAAAETAKAEAEKSAEEKTEEPKEEKIQEAPVVEETGLETESPASLKQFDDSSTKAPKEEIKEEEKKE